MVSSLHVGQVGDAGANANNGSTACILLALPYVLPDMLPSAEVSLWPGFRLELTTSDCGGQKWRCHKSDFCFSFLHSAALAGSFLWINHLEA